MENVYRLAECAKILINAGADTNIPNTDGNKPADLLSDEDDAELKKFFAE
ncbi:MAG TPA: hypothetical protein PL045_10790 [Chitinophagaceae bacterium]|nr:hypothetical protein [Chitinophagaceae bacterium]